MWEKIEKGLFKTWEALKIVALGALLEFYAGKGVMGKGKSFTNQLSTVLAAFH